MRNKNTIVNKIRIKSIFWYLFGSAGIIGLAFTIYSAVHEEKPSMLYDIENVSSVLDIHRPVEDLKILFQDEDIEESNLNLSIYTIRIENNGAVDISQNQFDQDLDWGLQIKGGKIIDSKLTDCNYEYLRKQIRPTILKNPLGSSMGDSIIIFNKTIFDSGKHFTLEMLAIFNKDDTLEIVPLGKITGLDEIQLIESWKEKGVQTFWQKAFTGKPTTHITRLIVYSIASLMLFILILFISVRIGKAKEKHKTKLKLRKMEELLPQMSTEQREKMERLFDLFSGWPPDRLAHIQQYLSDNENVRTVIRRHKTMRTTPNNHVPIYGYMVSTLVDNGFIKIDDDNKILIDPAFDQAIRIMLTSMK